jgi:hypothetical protein
MAELREKEEALVSAAADASKHHTTSRHITSHNVTLHWSIRFGYTYVRELRRKLATMLVLSCSFAQICVQPVWCMPSKMVNGLRVTQPLITLHAPLTQEWEPHTGANETLIASGGNSALQCIAVFCRVPVRVCLYVFACTCLPVRNLPVRNLPVRNLHHHNHGMTFTHNSIRFSLLPLH